MIINIPNILTFIRILAIPFFVLVFYIPTQNAHIIAACIFALAAITDWLDGYIARVMQQTSPLGEFLDPVADKLLVAVALVIIVAEHKLPYLAIPAAVIVGREIVISALREWMAEMGKRASVAVSFIGKFKTAIQMIALVLLLAFTPDSNKFFSILGYVFLYLAAILTLWSMFMYLKTAWPELTVRQEPVEKKLKKIT